MSPATAAARREVVPSVVAVAMAALVGPMGSSRRIVIEAAAGGGRSWTLDAVGAVFPVHVRRVTAVEASISNPYGVVCDLLEMSRPHPVPGDFAVTAAAGLEDVASGGPVALIVDDLHLVDAESLAVLRELTAVDAARAVVLIAGARTGSDRRAVQEFLADPRTSVWHLPPFDRVDLDVFVHDRTGCWPGDGLRDVLAPIAGNALHLGAVVDGLREAQRIGPVAGVIDLVGEPDGVEPRSFAGVTEDLIASMTGPELDLARALAVCGAPAQPFDLASLLSVPATALVPAMRGLLDSGVLVSVDDALAFGQDSWRQAVYDATPSPIRTVLHHAAAERVSGAERAWHVVASDSDGETVLSAIVDAQPDLGHSPGVAAELLDRAAQRLPSATPEAARLAAPRARALARSGQVARAAGAAQEALGWTDERDVLADLRRIMIFTLTIRARVRETIFLIDETLALSLPERTRRVLEDHRHFVALMGGDAPVPTAPFVVDASTGTLNGVIAEGLRRALLGNTSIAREFTWTASRLAMSEGVDPYEGSSADIWPPFVELLHAGPDAAKAALIDVVSLREERGAAWQTPGHQAIAASIELQAGRLDDAAAQFDSALEGAERNEMGWVSYSVGERALLDVLRSRLPDARSRISAWERDPGPDQFGIPAIERARVSLLEAERRYVEAAAGAARMWSRAGASRLFGWRAAVAPELARIALRATDGDLRQAVHDGLSSAPPVDGALAGAAAELARAMTGPEYLDVIDVAARVAADAADRGDGLLRLTALEEGAVAHAVAGDRDTARVRAREAIVFAVELGTTGISARISGRMRAAGVRLGSIAARTRPTHGWGSLTPTEKRVVALVVGGTTGPEIAGQLHVSPRTVQTHVSHALAKLGLNNRMELAAAARLE